MGNTKSRLDLSDNDQIIIVIGQPGAGKSSFINAVAGSNLPVGHNMRSCTTKVQCVTANRGDRRIIFVDTPSFDIEINPKALKKLKKNIEEWRKKTFTQNYAVAGIIYLHKISEPRMTEPPDKRLITFQSLCGDIPISEKVILVTTMWNVEKQEDAKRREGEIRKKYWKNRPMVRFNPDTDRHTQAWKAVDLLSAPATTGR